MGPEFYAVFTNEQQAAGPPVCASGQACRSGHGGLLPAGAKLYLVGSRMQTQSRDVCRPCYDHYRTREGTVRKLDPQPTPRIDIGHQQNVRADINLGYRQRASAPVQAVGAASRGPNVNVNAGYQPQHALYGAKKKAVASRAYEATDPHLVAVMVSVIYVTVSRGKHKQNAVGDLTRGVGKVPVSIGAGDLRRHVAGELARPWAAWSQNFPMPEFELFVAKGMVPLNPPAYGPDCDVLAGHIQYDKKAIPINLPLLFVITEDVADDVNMHREKAKSQPEVRAAGRRSQTVSSNGRWPTTTHQDGEWEPMPSSRTLPPPSGQRMPPPPPPARPRTPVNELRAKRSIQETRSTSDISNSPPAKRQTAPAKPQSPPVHRIRRALEGVEDVRPAEARHFLNTVTIPGRLYYERTFASLDALMEAPPLSLETLGSPVRALLYLSKKTIGVPGSFKTSMAAQLCSVDSAGFPAHFAFQSGDRVCAKTGIRKRGKKREAIPDMDALPMFKQEMHAMEWSKGLMQASYAAIKRKLGLAKGDRPPVDIPSLSFVWCALFIADAPPPGEPRRLDGGVYLIEELLDANQYYKWLGNGSTVPLDCDKGDFLDFLNFLQHVQWEETGGNMFVSDFQGVFPKLTDPQVMTRTEFTDKFTDANVLHGFQSLVNDHHCGENKYCKFFDMIEPARHPNAYTVVRDPPTTSGSGNLEHHEEAAKDGDDGDDELEPPVVGSGGNVASTQDV